jgi:uncharacterized protein (TIGR02118 family)
MVKIVGFLKRKPGITRQEFKDYWLGQHIRLERASLQTQPLRRIVANFVEDDLIDIAPFDGMVELYFDDLDQMRAMWESGHDETMKNDEANFCDVTYRVFCRVEEVEIGSRSVGSGIPPHA